MKKILIIALAIFTMSLSAQEKMGEKEALKESHIDFTKQYLWFVIHGKIEIDGHIYTNHNKECPTVIYKANLDGVSIVDTCTNTEYIHRVCKVKGCNIIHLEEKQAQFYISPQWNYPNWQLYLNDSGIILDSTFHDLNLNYNFNGE